MVSSGAAITASVGNYPDLLDIFYDMELTYEQQQMANAIDDLIHGRRPGQTLVCHGVAGTGKTSVLCETAERNPDAILCAYTGKAASNLRRKSGLDAKTIHSLFYKLVEKEKDKKTGKTILHFERVHAEGALVGKVVLLDECSMVDTKTAYDLMVSGAKIVAVGDPGQLPPVHGAEYFNEPDITLTEIHRQALESPILRQAHNMRANGCYEADGEDFKVVKRISDKQLMEADTILCWRNATRHRLNAKLRSLHGCDMPYPMAGEPVLCLKNSHRYGIFNGNVYTLAEAFQPEDRSIILSIDGQSVEVPKVAFVEPGGSLDDYDDDRYHSVFDYGYALTVHKAQGSEWDKVVLFDENNRHDLRRWCYTAITRAAKSIIVQAR